MAVVHMMGSVIRYIIAYKYTWTWARKYARTHGQWSEAIVHVFSLVANGYWVEVGYYTGGRTNRNAPVVVFECNAPHILMKCCVSLWECAMKYAFVLTPKTVRFDSICACIICKQMWAVDINWVKDKEQIIHHVHHRLKCEIGICFSEKRLDFQLILFSTFQNVGWGLEAYIYNEWIKTLSISFIHINHHNSSEFSIQLFDVYVSPILYYL